MGTRKTAVGAEPGFLPRDEIMDGKPVVRDRLWLWGHEPGSHNKGWNLPAKSRVTAVEAVGWVRRWVAETSETIL